MTPDEVFTELPKHFDGSGAADMNATILFDLAGENGGQWTVTIADGRATTTRGAAGSPNMTITANAADYIEMIEGRLDPQMAFMNGRLSLGGDISIAMRMQGLFKRPGA